MKNGSSLLRALAGLILFIGALVTGRAADAAESSDAAMRADTNAKASANPRFDQLDADGDGRVSRQEYLGSITAKRHWWQLGQRTATTDQNSATPTMFSTLDRNKDGYLTNDELNAGRRLEESRGDNGPGASTTRNVHPPGSPRSSQKTESDTAAEKRAQQENDRSK